MPRKFFKGLTVFMALIFIYGCQTAERVKVRSYIQEKERVDQEMDGNVGYIMGSSKGEEKQERKKTRKVYVLEVSQNPPDGPQGSDIAFARQRQEAGLTDTQTDAAELINPYAAPDVSLPLSLEGESDFSPTDKEASYIEYTVEKDDTLQKISKKFYDAYSKWPIIYEANRDVIKNPDAISPGVVIRIPMQ